MVGLLSLTLLLVFVRPLRVRLFSGWSRTVLQSEARERADLQKEVARLKKQIELVSRRLDQKTPNEPYIVIDTSGNRIYVRQGKQTLREAICSTGSYINLKTRDGMEWIFFTPRGQFRVLAKKVAPVWVKPDWAFVEEGLPIPPKHSPERYEYGVLGEYALAFGNGYLIHGTLYKRLMGMPVTHGCVRVGDEDLEYIYKTVPLGAKIYIY
ncbi:MAG: L,D-transpeptidase family protein [candidate division KSB1 bacterium]|nr:L,D-transpeptidase family protein [candidate division KSB1 bacterium]